MAQKMITHKDGVAVIQVSNADAELLKKSWSLTFDRKKDKNGVYQQGSYARVKRTLNKAEKAERGTSRTSLHKEVWIKYFGQVPNGMTIDHITITRLIITFQTCSFYRLKKIFNGKKG